MIAILQVGAALLAAGLLTCPAAWAADPAITFVEDRPANAKAILVMDAGGADRSEIFRTEKHYPGNFLRPAISTDGQWVAIAYPNFAEGILGIATTGGEPQWLLCGAMDGGTLINSYLEFSPTGAEIVVQSRYFQNPGPDPDFLMIIPRDGLGICPYRFDQLDVLRTIDPGGYTWGVSWKPDGTQVAYFESDPVLELEWVVILDRATGVETARIPVAWPPGSSPWDLDFEPSGLSWQRSGQLVFATSGLGYVWLLEYDEPSGSLVARQLTAGSEPVWSPDDAQLLYGADGQLTSLTLASGFTESLGPGYRPDWKRGPLFPSSCTGDPDCDDGNECTEDLCVGGECSHSPLAEGTPCGIAGCCSAGICFEPECGPGLPECDDGNVCTVDGCVEYGCVAGCVFDPAGAAGVPCDDGDPCTTGDRCDGVTGGCAGDFDPTIPGCGCGPKGAPCSFDAECCSRMCHPVKGTCK